MFFFSKTLCLKGAWMTFIPDFLFQLFDYWAYFQVKWLRNSLIIQPISKAEILKLYWVDSLSQAFKVIITKAKLWTMFVEGFVSSTSFGRTLLVLNTACLNYCRSKFVLLLLISRQCQILLCNLKNTNFQPNNIYIC